MQGRGRGREELEREASFSFGVNDPYSLQTRLDMEAIGDTGRILHPCHPADLVHKLHPLTCFILSVHSAMIWLDAWLAASVHGG